MHALVAKSTQKARRRTQNAIWVHLTHSSALKSPCSNLSPSIYPSSYGLIVSDVSITLLSEVTNLMAFINSFNVNEELTGHFPEAVECLEVNMHVYISFLYKWMLLRQVIVLEELVWNWYRHWRSNSYSIYYGKAEIVKASQAVLCGTCHICLYYMLHKYCSL